MHHISTLRTESGLRYNINASASAGIEYDIDVAPVATYIVSKLSRQRHLQVAHPTIYSKTAFGLHRAWWGGHGSTNGMAYHNVCCGRLYCNERRGSQLGESRQERTASNYRECMCKRYRVPYSRVHARPSPPFPVNISGTFEESISRRVGDRGARKAHVSPGGRLGQLVEGVWRRPRLGARAPLSAPRRELVADVVVDRLLDRHLQARLCLAALLRNG